MFYIIERQEQLHHLGLFKDCFVKFIQQNDNYHPKLSPLSLVYVRDITQHKGYILCINHSESFSLTQNSVIEWLLNNTDKLFVLNKKEAMYHFPHPNKLYDINFMEINFKKEINLNNLTTTCHTFYYNKFTGKDNVNALIPISKHYEESEKIFDVVIPLIKQYRLNNAVYEFNNGPLTQTFYEIESQGIKIDKQCFIDSYGDNLKYPQFNISKSRIYSQYNLYTTTGRPSNTYNTINFAALDKNNGERLCYRPANDMFVSYDIQGYHPRLVGEMIGFDFGNKNTYDVLSELLNVTPQETKELTFKQLYGGVWSEYRNKPFFKGIITLTDDIWDTYQYGKYYETENRIFYLDKNMTQSKLLNYIIQSKETTTNVKMLVNILDYLKDKQTKLVLYIYDELLFDYSKEDGQQLLIDIKDMINYPINIKQGKSYHSLKKI